MCTIDRTCDICAFWSAAQWELFVNKRSSIDRMEPSCPSGYVPPAPLASPRVETPSGVSQLGLLPLLFPALQVVRGRGGRGLGMHLVLCPGGLPPLPLDLGPARGVGVLLDYRLLLASALSLRWLFRELAKGELLGRSGLFCARYAPRLSLTIPRRTLDDVGNCGRLRRIATAFYPLVVPDLRIVVHGGIRELVHGPVVFVDRSRLSRSRSSSR